MTDPEKITIDGIPGLRSLEGKRLFVSPPIEVTKERIQEFCRSVENDEWIHWDEERAKASPLGGLIAPAMFVPALFPKVFWDHVEIENIPDILFLGTDRIRLLKPVVAGSALTVSAELARVEDRGQGVAAYYGASFDTVGDTSGPAAVATFIVRYWHGEGIHL